MKIYFSSSMRAKKLYGEIFTKIHQAIEDLGHHNTSDFLLKADPDEFYRRSPDDEKNFYTTMIMQMKAADVCVFEVSRHSLGIGYSVNAALDFGKPVVLLYQAGHKPYLFSAIKSDKLILTEYTKDSVVTELREALKQAKENIDIRFTFFITPRINSFLRMIAKTEKKPRAVYLRNLLEEQMKKRRF